jgi:hypothetical protein
MEKITVDDIFESIIQKDPIVFLSLYNKLKNSNKDRYILRRLFDYGDPLLLQIAIENGIGKIDQHYLFEAAGTSLSMLKKCFELNPMLMDKKYFDPRLADKAANAGLVDVLEYLKDIGSEFNWGPSMTALENDNLVIFKWLELNFPDKVYYAYGYRSNCKTYDCFRYLYSKGYMPGYQNYKIALQTDDTEYAEWLISIKCPGTYDILEIPTNYHHKFEYGLDAGDLPWILSLAKTRQFPSINKVYWTPPLLIILEELLESPLFINDHDVLNYVFEYIGAENYIIEHFNAMTMYELFGKIKSAERTIELIDKMKLDRYTLAQLYDVYEYEADSDSIESEMEPIDDNDSETNLKNIKIRDYLIDKVDWGTMFLVDLNAWINREGSYQPSEFIRKIEELWEKYEDKIPQLKNIINKNEWAKLVESDPWKQDMHDFIYSLEMW